MSFNASCAFGPFAHGSEEEYNECQPSAVSGASFGPPSPSGPALARGGFEAYAELRRHYNSLAGIEHLEQGSWLTPTLKSHTLELGESSLATAGESLIVPATGDPRIWYKRDVTVYTNVSVAVGGAPQGALPSTFDVRIEEKPRIAPKKSRTSDTHQSVTFSLPSAPRKIWEADSEALHEYLQVTFNLDGNFMKRDDIWNRRSRSCMYQLTQNMKSLVKTAYKQYLLENFRGE